MSGKRKLRPQRSTSQIRAKHSTVQVNPSTDVSRTPLLRSPPTTNESRGPFPPHRCCSENYLIIGTSAFTPHDFLLIRWYSCQQVDHLFQVPHCTVRGNNDIEKLLVVRNFDFDGRRGWHGSRDRDILLVNLVANRVPFININIRTACFQNV